MRCSRACCRYEGRAACVGTQFFSSSFLFLWMFFFVDKHRHPKTSMWGCFWVDGGRFDPSTRPLFNISMVHMTKSLPGVGYAVQACGLEVVHVSVLPSSVGGPSKLLLFVSIIIWGSFCPPFLVGRYLYVVTSGALLACGFCSEPMRVHCKCHFTDKSTNSPHICTFFTFFEFLTLTNPVDLLQVVPWYTLCNIFTPGEHIQTSHINNYPSCSIYVLVEVEATFVRRVSNCTSNKQLFPCFSLSQFSLPKHCTSVYTWYT